jgi:hypothetical protein
MWIVSTLNCPNDLHDCSTAKEDTATDGFAEGCGIVTIPSQCLPQTSDFVTLTLCRNVLARLLSTLVKNEICMSGLSVYCSPSAPCPAEDSIAVSSFCAVVARSTHSHLLSSCVENPFPYQGLVYIHYL